ncbi:MAG: hypothetical protein GAK43_00506 [Stenotrophomonas maltophilia]|nr:MAG: hypothetical protein GAK43_00506 [Stenotrophomonas maltophilia]
MPRTPLRLTLAIACATAGALAYAEPHSAASRISAVTVYLDRAVVTRAASLSLPAGEQEIVLDGLPDSLDDSSLQAQLTASGGATLLDVSSADQVLEAADGGRLQALDQQLREVDEQTRALEDRGTVLSNQKQWLERLQSSATEPGKDQPAPSLETLKGLMQLSESNLERLLSEQRKLDQQRETLEQRREALQAQRDQLAGDGRHYKRAVLRLALQQPAQVQLQLSYSLPDANWRPAYDARLREGSDKVELTYQGVVRQRSGEDWNDVDLTLSTAQPSLGNAAPSLSPWLLDVRQPMLAEASRDALVMPAPAAPAAARPLAGSLAKISEERRREVPLAVAQVEAGMTSAAFHIPVRTTLASDGSARKVTIAQLQLPAQLRHLATPALQAGAFLEADTHNASELPLLPGTLNSYLGNRFVSRGELKAVMPGEHFDLALGGDPGLAIERTLVKRYTESAGLTGGRTRVIYEYRFDVQNHHKDEQRIAFRDHLPVSRNEQIAVALLAPSAADMTREDDGQLRWDWTLKAGEKRSTTLKFSVEYPRELDVAGLE